MARVKIKSAKNQSRKSSSKDERQLTSKCDTLNNSKIGNAKQKFPNDDFIWSPNIQNTFKALASARLCAAVWNNIQDCDETYNYWEPMHYLIYGTGFQTWEYSPAYALRSYAYILMHALPARVYGIFLQSNRILVFYFMRCLLGFVCSTLETYFIKGVNQAYGLKVGRLAFVFLLFSAGMFQSSSAFLPSSFSMYMCLLSFGAWFQKQYIIAIISTGLSIFLSWPFAAILGAGIAIDVLFRLNKWKLFFGTCILSAAVILVPIVIIDSSFYGRLVIAPLNIVLYNVFSEHGPDLYGTSPWSFYFLNGFLNFNFVFLLALASLLVIPLTLRLEEGRQRVPTWLALLPLYLWILIFFTRPHKEERFLYPIYPLICLAAAITWDKIVLLGQKLTSLSFVTKWLTVVLVLSSSVLSVSRIVGQYKGFHAPMDVFLELNHLSWEKENETRTANVCIGKEWHRFPSSFFLPDNWNLLFLPSEFRGQLPRPYDPLPNGTLMVPPNMNDLNLEEPSRYASVKDCHYLIDLETVEESEREPRYSQMSNEWREVYRVNFIDSSRSPQLLRAFYIPWLSETYCQTVPYVLLKRTAPTANKKWN